MENYASQQIEDWKEKAEKWDALNVAIGKFYPDDDSDPTEGLGLMAIGERAASAFGYL